MSSTKNKISGQKLILFSTSEIIQIHQAVSDTRIFTEDVAKRLLSIQWKIIGFAQLPDGSPDFNKPHHKMPYPNICISEILSNYTDVIKDQLITVARIIEKARSSIYQEKPGISGVSSLSEVCADDSSTETIVVSNESNCVKKSNTAVIQSNPSKKLNKNRKIRKEDFEPLKKKTNNAFHSSLDSSFSSSTSSAGSNKQHNIDALDSKESKPSGTDPHENLHYIIARKYRSPSTAETLGCPAFNLSGELIGFYRKLESNLGSQFISIDDLQPLCRLAVNSELRGLLDAKLKERKIDVYCMDDWGCCLDIMVEEALEYAYI